MNSTHDDKMASGGICVDIFRKIMYSLTNMQLQILRRCFFISEKYYLLKDLISKKNVKGLPWSKLAFLNVNLIIF